MKTKFFLYLILVFCGLCSFAQTTIQEARLQGVGSTVTFTGIVTNGAELGVIRYIQDETAGLAIYDSNFASAISRGDSITVTGVLADFNNLLELNPITNLTVINSGNALPEPQNTTPAALSEDMEGELIQLDNISFTNAGSTFSGNASYTFTSGAESSSIFVRNGSPLIGQTIPIGSLTMVGLCSQFQANYQVLPRDMNDFILSAGINITSVVSVTAINTFGFTLNWTTDVSGTSEVQYGLTPLLEMGAMSNSNMGTNHSFPVFGLTAGEIYYCRVYSVADGDTAFSSIRPYGVASQSSGEITVYFNTSVDTSVSSGQNATLLYHAIDDTLIAYINRAELSLDLTIYDFDNADISNISQAINDAKERGVRVRFISDGSQAPTNFGVPELDTSIPRIESPTTGAYNIMHNKFVIIDAEHTDPMKPLVWTGSTNWTDRQINRDNNSVVIVQDQTLARSYTLEFEEMWGSTDTIPDMDNSRFGPFKLDNTPHEFVIGGKRVESYFSPSDGTNSKIVNTINTANQEIAFASMIITRQDLAQALLAKYNSGVLVRGITNDSTSTSSQYPLLNSSLPADDFVANPWPIDSIIMHHKYLIADMNTTNSDPLVWVGSHNWTSSANNTNDENSLVIHDAIIANLYYQEFNALFNQDSVVVVVPDSLQITFRVDMTQESVSPSGVHLVTDYNSWNPTSFQMNNMGNGIYEYVLQVPAGTSMFYRFANGINSIDMESVPVSCAVMATDGMFARLLNAESEDIVLNTVCFEECVACIPVNVTEITFRVDMTQQSVSPSGVHLVTDLNSWNPTSYQMSSIGNEIYEYVLEVPAGTSMFYRFANGINSTDMESVPASCGMMATDGELARLLNAESVDLVVDTVCFGECAACIPDNVISINAVDWSLFPNPVNKGGRVNAQVREAGFYHVLISDIKNSIVYTSELYLNSGRNELPYQFQNTGNYIVTMTSANTQLSYRITVKD